MYFVVFATHKEEMGQERLQLQDAFAAYLHDLTQHPDVTVHQVGRRSARVTRPLPASSSWSKLPRSRWRRHLSPAGPMLRRAPSPSLTSAHGTG